MNKVATKCGEKEIKLTIERYNCPITGAHFRFNDIVVKLNKVAENRQRDSSPHVMLNFVSNTNIMKERTAMTGRKITKKIHI